MSEYRPDKWVILKIKNKDQVAHKVLAGWSGSYLEGQSWKINSGISKCEVDGDYFLFHGYSGSVYKCYRKAYGTNMIMNGIISQATSVDGVHLLNEQEAIEELKL